MVDPVLQTIAGLLTLLISVFLYLRLLFRSRQGNRTFKVAFLHPNCNAGGGGERVLWMAIESIQKTYPNSMITIYSGRNDCTDEEILKRAETTFGLQMARPIKFIRLWSAALAEAKYYPRFTLVGQALGMSLMGIECILRSWSHVLIDTQGCAFAYPFFWISGTAILAYVHYPYLSSDLVHPSGKSRTRLWRTLALPYYRMIGKIYQWCGNLVSVSMANSSWTLRHIDALWKVTSHLVYPPCDLARMQLWDASGERELLLFSLAQFRPEKNQRMQLFIMDSLFRRRPDWKGKVKLVVCGGCRGQADRRRAAELQQLCKELDIGDSVEFVIDASHDNILARLSRASIGLHTMREEHFGISIVEFMASGLITIAHRSGGPQSDLIRCEEEGFLCDSVEEYARTIESIILMPESARSEIRSKARDSAVSRFHSSVFHKKFLDALRSVEPLWDAKQPS